MSLDEHTRAVGTRERDYGLYKDSLSLYEHGAFQIICNDITTEVSMAEILELFSDYLFVILTMLSVFSSWMKTSCREAAFLKVSCFSYRLCIIFLHVHLWQLTESNPFGVRVWCDSQTWLINLFICPLFYAVLMNISIIRRQPGTGHCPKRGRHTTIRKLLLTAFRLVSYIHFRGIKKW